MQEVPTLNRERIRECFTEKELKDLDSEFMKHALGGISFWTTVPITIACGDPATAAWYVFSRCCKLMDPAHTITQVPSHSDTYEVGSSLVLLQAA